MGHFFIKSPIDKGFGHPQSASQEVSTVVSRLLNSRDQRRFFYHFPKTYADHAI